MRSCFVGSLTFNPDKSTNFAFESDTKIQMKYFLFLPALFLSYILISCESSPTEEQRAKPEAQALIDKAISLHGGNLYQDADIAFSFRGKQYTSTHDQGAFTYTRGFEEEGDSYKDIMTSETFVRKINGEPVAVPDTMVRKYRNSINSVLYFALLPYKLNDAAVKKKYMGQVKLGEKDYHQIEITFAQEGGGEDHQDVFLYFVDTETGLMDHLAYSYETEGGGRRFRKGYNYRTIDGIRFADYVNFKDNPTSDIHQIADAYNAGKLDTLSLIELEDIVVKR